MPISTGLKNSLNRIREISSEIYHQYIPIIDDNTSITNFAQPIIDMPEIRNEFMNNLVNRIAYTQFEIKYFNNPLQILEGDSLPLGYVGQDVYINPSKGRQYNGEDFAGLLQKYEADVKVQYLPINMDLQYPVTINRYELMNAFTSWDRLNTFIDGISNALYNGAYIDEFQFTKAIVSSAYQNNQVKTEIVTDITTEATAKAFIQKARELFLNFQLPSTKYNAWNLVDNKGRPVTTWSNKDDIVFLIRNDIMSYIDVNVLAASLNITKTELLGRIIPIDNFDLYNDNGVKIFDGSKIIGFIGEKSWFKIRRRDMFLDTFYNANNRTYQYYLNLTKMYQHSLFANGVVFSTEMPSIAITGLSYNDTTEINVEVGSKEGLDIIVTPANATSPKITYENDSTDIVSLITDSNNDRHITVEGLKAGSAMITAKAGNVETSIEVTVTAPVQTMSAKSRAKATNTTAKASNTTNTTAKASNTTNTTAKASNTTNTAVIENIDDITSILS